MGFRLALVLVALAAAASATASFAADTGRSRPVSSLKEADKTIWMTEWVACHRTTLHVLARELGLKVTPNHTVQTTALLFAKFAERNIYDPGHDFTTGVDGCRNGILWRFFHS